MNLVVAGSFFGYCIGSLFGDPPTGGKGYHGAAEYFGISDAQARACFGGEKETAKFHHRWFIDRITPSDVGKALLALPYVRRY